MRHAEGALTHGSLAWLDNDVPDATLSYLRTFDHEQILTVVNLSGRQVSVQIGVPPEGMSAFRELLVRGVKVEVTNEGKKVLALEANGFFVGKR